MKKGKEVSSSNIDDEEEPYLDQDDLTLNFGNVNHKDNNESATPRLRKRYFYQMHFELELPYTDDTVYLAYSRPYSYTKIIAHMLEMEEQLSELPGGGKYQAEE